MKLKPVILFLLIGICLCSQSIDEAAARNLGVYQEKNVEISDETLNFKNDYCKELPGTEFHQGDLFEGSLLTADISSKDPNTKGTFQTRLNKGLINKFDDTGRSVWIRVGSWKGELPQTLTLDSTNPDDYKFSNTGSLIKNYAEFLKLETQNILTPQGPLNIKDTDVYTVLACRGVLRDALYEGEKEIFYKVSLFEKPKDCTKEKTICGYFSLRNGLERIRMANHENSFEKKYFTNYLDCPAYERELKNPEYGLITVQSHVLFGGDLIYYIGHNQNNDKKFVIPLRGGIGDQFEHVADVTEGNLELIPDGTNIFKVAVNNLKKLDGTTNRETLPGKSINANDYYEFNGCGLYNKPSKTLVGIYNLQYQVTDGGPPCDCEKCCRTGGFFGPTNGKVGCMKKIRRLRSAAAIEFKLLNEFLDVQMKKHLTKENLNGLEEEIFKDPVIVDHMQKLKTTREELQLIDECVNCNALSRQYFKLWNHDKWLDSFSRDKGEDFLRRQNIGSFEGWDRTDPNMFAVCDVCQANPKGPRKTSCSKIELEEDRLKDKHKEVGYSDKLFNKKNLNEILNPLKSSEKDKDRKYSVTHYNVNSDSGEETRKRAGLLGSGGEISSSVSKHEENFVIEKKNTDTYKLEDEGEKTTSKVEKTGTPVIKSQTEGSTKSSIRRRAV